MPLLKLGIINMYVSVYILKLRTHNLDKKPEAVTEICVTDRPHYLIFLKLCRIVHKLFQNILIIK